MNNSDSPVNAAASVPAGASRPDKNPTGSDQSGQPPGTSSTTGGLPFAGLRVLDFTHVLAGPFCSFQLAMLGAEVIKVESPGLPDMMRQEGPLWDRAEAMMGLHYLSQNAGKQALALDLSQPEAATVLARLVPTADVLVVNYRPAAAARLGIDVARMQALNPQLIYCSMTGFGTTGPKADDPAYDNVIQAFSGLMEATGDADGGAIKVGPPVLDYGTGAQAALAISAALYRRLQTGAGEFIDVAMLDAALMLMTSTTVETAATGVAPARHGNSSSTRAGYGCYETAAGQLMLGAFTQRQHADLWEYLGDSSRAAANANASVRDMVQRCSEDRAELQRLLATRSASAWERGFNSVGVPAARVRKLDETLREPQVASRQLLQPVTDPLSTPPTTSQLNAATETNSADTPAGDAAAGTTSQTATATLTTATTAWSYRDASRGGTPIASPPRLGEHTDALLAALGFSETEVKALRDRAVIPTDDNRAS